MRQRKTQVSSPALKPGNIMPDGTVYAGISPQTGKSMYAAPADASLEMTFNEAQKHAAQLDAHGHHDWRLPTKAELNVLFNNRAAIGGFNTTSSDPTGPGWYGSASQFEAWRGDRGIWAQCFSDGDQDGYVTQLRSSWRYIRRNYP